ncbi:hypothetical protein KYK30_03915 [Shinella yambaruensis]|uniref:hypothetical protein n=1 Tax=Shinella TaxID=323620 RepID=UPI001FD29C30|nr:MULTISPECIES: hypothetical protein [Shinella]MCJ8024030.1 hypothetical protein [Shinella yambaruensis]MCO5140379.1 hypothetical protein [Shinella sp.]MCU7978820.1 hypothetical protein [Shinella yambaruensis]MCW5705880.1 hypothetical protein [Shinella sp.]MDC7254899.1 hypothetical protein [Shinella sp. YE25]
MNMLVLLAHLRLHAKRDQRQIVHCENRLSGNAISTLSNKFQATFARVSLNAEVASFLFGLASAAATAD